MLWRKNTKRIFEKNFIIWTDKKAAFTTVEVIAVLSLMLLMSAVGLHRLWHTHILADEFVSQFASDIRYVSRKTPYNKEKTELHYLFQIRKQSGREEVIGYEIKENGFVTKRTEFPERFFVQSENSMTKISFHRSGSFQGKGETIRIDDIDSGNFYRITIVPFSGRVEVYKNE